MREPESRLEPVSETSSADEVRAALDRLRSRMRRATDPHPIQLEFLEDDLREGRRALEEVSDFFDEAVELLSRRDARAIDLIDFADGTEVLDRLDYLVVVANNLRRRMLQLARR